jgi:hypothetical protein
MLFVMLPGIDNPLDLFALSACLQVHRQGLIALLSRKSLSVDGTSLPTFMGVACG